MELEVDVDTTPTDEIKRAVWKQLGDDTPVEIQCNRTGQGNTYNIRIDDTGKDVKQNKIDKIESEIMKIFEKRGHRPYMNKGEDDGMG